MRTVVTGGAGFIGSGLAEALAERGDEVTVIDDFSTGSEGNLRGVEGVRVVRGDLTDFGVALRGTEGADSVFHLAANYSVRRSSEEPVFDMRSNLLTTLNVLEAMRRNGVPKIVFTSSSTVYGETDIFPIAETAALAPVSNYGASKLAAESYIRSFSKLYGIDGLVLRYANIIGPRCNHGIVRDFVDKLHADPRELVVLGDGRQKKSYLDVEDCVRATVMMAERAKGFDVFNVGSEEWVTADEIARIVCEGLGLEGVELEHTGGEVGWPGDVSRFLLDVGKLKALGWAPSYNIRDSILRTVAWLEGTR